MQERLPTSTTVKNLLFLGKFLVLLGITAIYAGSACAAGKGDGKYVPATIQSVSNALFKIGVLHASDPLAVDEYVRIHHCGLYEQYGTDDVAWTRIREAQARDLMLKEPSLDENLEVQTSLIMGDYDFTQSQFAFVPATALTNLGLITVQEIDSGNYEPCTGEAFKPFVPRAHPLRLVAHLSVPLTLSELPVARATAEQLIKMFNERERDGAQRSVMLVMHLHLTGADPLAGSADSSNMTVMSDLDDIEVYDGPDRKLLLFSKKFIAPQAGKTDLR